MPRLQSHKGRISRAPDPEVGEVREIEPHTQGAHRRIKYHAAGVEPVKNQCVVLKQAVTQRQRAAVIENAAWPPGERNSM